MIGPKAWGHAASLGVRPQCVFAHPNILMDHPVASRYYRGIALLSQKQVARLAAPVVSWEDGSRRKPIELEAALRVTSSIIEGSIDWTLDNGYRNILATMAIGLDGMIKNRIGQNAEQLVKMRIAEWVKDRTLLLSTDPPRRFLLERDTWMIFGSEPDIEFVREGRTVATIEIKGGKDPAGALERLGAVQKSFSETSPGCVNFLVAGVVTEQMRNRLDNMGVVQTFLLDDIADSGREWERFVNELFHHTLRLT